MRQEINLYQRPSQVQAALSASTLLVATVLIAMVLLCIYGYGQFTVTRLQHQVDVYLQQQQLQAQLAEAGDVLIAGRVDQAALQLQVKQLTQTVQHRQQALNLLRTGTPVVQAGFAARLAALAHPHVAGVWLDGVMLNDAPGIQSLSGRSLNPALVAGYLRALGTEPALSGTRFSAVRILGPKYVDKEANGDAGEQTPAAAPSPGVSFRVETAAVIDNAAAGKPI
jgi:hypothetical protein